MEDNFPMEGVSGGGGNGFRMIQVHYVHCPLSAITSAPPPIIRHQIPEVGDPWSRGPQPCTHRQCVLYMVYIPQTTYYTWYILYHGASLVAQTVGHLPALQENLVQSLGWEEPLEKEMATHSSNLAWKIPWREEPGRLQSMGLQRVGHD